MKLIMDSRTCSCVVSVVPVGVGVFVAAGEGAEVGLNLEGVGVVIVVDVGLVFGEACDVHSGVGVRFEAVGFGEGKLFNE